MATTTTCRVCGNPADNPCYIAREMMFGFKDEFEYFECSRCGCLQLAELPSSLSRYYAGDYYSYSEATTPNPLILPLKSLLKRQRLKYCLGESNPLGMLLSKIFGAPDLAIWIKKADLKKHHDILDVGCGVGHRLLDMNQLGFSSLTGIDPFIERDITYKNGVRVFRKKLSDVNEQFDFIMLHHTFEHMPDPLPALRNLHRVLRQDGLVLIRIPIVSSYAWRKYKTNWVQLDAPRHLFLHSVKSIRLLADSACFSIKDIDFDSTAFQFWGSEQYARDIPLRDERSYSSDPRRSIFSKKEIREFQEKAEELNRGEEGDQACFYLVKR